MKLLALLCPKCQHPLNPQNDHLLVVCENCYTPIEIGDEGLRQIELTFAAPQEGIPVTHWQPFWIFEGQTQLIKREIQGRRSNTNDAREFWQQPRQLYVPAWDLAPHTAQKVGRSMILEQPRFERIPGPELFHLLPVVVNREDAVKLLEFIVMAIEARRDDWLKKLAFRLQVLAPVLWAIPANERGIIARVS